MNNQLPREAYAIPGREDQPETWYLPHHRASVARAYSPSAGTLAQGGSEESRVRVSVPSQAALEKSVEWTLMAASVDALGGRRDARIFASPEDRLAAANHLAAHYRAAGKPLPDILAARADN